MIKITQQKIEKVLNAAGLTKSKYHKSQQVRGYGESTIGYRVTKHGLEYDDKMKVIHWNSWKVSFIGSVNDAWNISQVNKIEEALQAAGIPYTKPTWFFIPRYYEEDKPSEAART